MSAVFPITDQPRFRIHDAADGQTVFTIPYPFQASADIKVVKIAADGTETELAQPANYVVSGEGSPVGGSYTLVVPAVAGEKYLNAGAAVMDRILSIVRNGRFNSSAIDDDFDRAVIRDMELRRDIDRAFRVPFGKTGKRIDPLPEGHFHKVDAEGNLVDGGSAEDIGNAQQYASQVAADKAAVEQLKQEAEAARDTALGAVPNVFASSRSIMKALDTTTISHSWFDSSQWMRVDYADFSSLIDADSQEAIFARSTSDGAKAWMRQFDDPILASWFGMVGDDNGAGTTGTDNSVALQAALDMAVLLGRPLHIDKPGRYNWNSTVEVTTSRFFMSAGPDVVLQPIGTSNLGINVKSPSGGASPIANIGFKNMRFVSPQNDGALSGIQLDSVAVVDLDNCDFFNFLSTDDDFEEWAEGQSITTGDFRWYNGNVYQATTTGITGSVAPTGSFGPYNDGGVTWAYRRPIRTGLRINYGLYVSLRRFKSSTSDAALICRWDESAVYRSTTIKISDGSRLRSSKRGAILIGVAGFDIRDQSCAVENNSIGLHFAGRRNSSIDNWGAEVGCYFERNGKHIHTSLRGAAQHVGINVDGAFITHVAADGFLGVDAGDYKVDVCANAHVRLGHNTWSGATGVADINDRAGSAIKVDSRGTPGDLLTFVGNGKVTFAEETRNGVSADHGDSAYIIKRDDPIYQRWASPLTTGRTATLPTTGIADGHRYVIMRQTGASGSFGLIISDGTNTIDTLTNANTAVTVVYQGGAWLKAS